MDIVVRQPLASYPDAVVYVDNSELDVVVRAQVLPYPDVAVYSNYVLPAPAISGEGTTSVEIGLATETDSALSLGRLKKKGIGLATESDQALALSPRKRRLVGLAAEVGTAFNLSPKKSRGVGLASEVDVAFALLPSTGTPATIPTVRHLGVNPILRNRRKRYSLGS